MSIRSLLVFGSIVASMSATQAAPQDVSSSGMNVVSSSGMNVVSSSGMNVVSSSGMNVVSSSGMSIIFSDSTKVRALGPVTAEIRTFRLSADDCLNSRIGNEHRNEMCSVTFLPARAGEITSNLKISAFVAHPAPTMYDTGTILISLTATPVGYHVNGPLNTLASLSEAQFDQVIREAFSKFSMNELTVTVHTPSSVSDAKVPKFQKEEL